MFAVVSLAITHTLLSYFVGVSELRQWVTQSPAQHPWAFGVIAVSSLAVWFNFVVFRDQMCIIACPYGRFQSVLFDPQSLAVRYNDRRGEPRGKIKRVSLPQLGDCVDCSLCVQVCPTGIDIRDGVQLECINCTQCMDACDHVMRKTGRPEKLIGYYSQVELDGGRRRLLRPRVVVYSSIMVVFASIFTILIVTKKPFDVSLARNMGLPFTVTPEGQVQNVMRLTLRNRTNQPQHYRIESLTDGVSFADDLSALNVAAHDSMMQPINFVIDPAKVHGMLTASVLIRDANNASRTLQCQLFGPGGGQ
jgi:cytochrome c oxidase accessory protein FixG